MLLLLTMGSSENLWLKMVGEMYFIHNGPQIIRLQNRKMNILNTHFKSPYSSVLFFPGWSFVSMLNNPWWLKHLLLMTCKAISLINLLKNVLILLASGAGDPPARIQGFLGWWWEKLCVALYTLLTWVSQEAHFFSCAWQGHRGSM